MSEVQSKTSSGVSSRTETEASKASSVAGAVSDSGVVSASGVSGAVSAPGDAGGGSTVTLPAYKAVAAGEYSGPDLAARELAAFLSWELSILNLYHRKCILEVLAPLQKLVQPRRAVEMDLEKRLKLAPKGVLELGLLSNTRGPSHAHPLSKRAACHRLNASLSTLESILRWGKKTVLFIENLPRGKDQPHTGRVAKSGITPVLLSIYDYVEAIGYIWNYPTVPRSTLANIPLPDVPARHSATRTSGTGSSSRQQSSSQSRRKAAGRDSLLETPVAQLRGGGGSSSLGEEEETEEAREQEEEEEETERRRLQAAEKEGLAKELTTVRALEHKLTFHRRMVGWLVHEFAELMRILGAVFPSDSGYNLPASRKDVVALGLRLPPNYAVLLHSVPAPFPDHLQFRSDIHNPPF